MDRSYKFSIAQLHANPIRGERLNFAVVVFDGDTVHVHPAKNLEKARAITAALHPAAIEQALLNFVEIDKGLVAEGMEAVDERISALSSLSPLKLTTVGSFYASDATVYNEQVSRLLSQLVEPEPAPAKPRVQKRTRLLSAVKSAFRAERVLARKGEGIDSHRVVVNEQLADGLNADMLLKNGAMHVVQTVDASSTERARRAIQEVGVSALVFEQARIKFGNQDTKPRLVYSASSALEKSLTPALFAAQHQGAELINWESLDDRTGFIVDMSALAEPITGQKRVDFGKINASNKEFRRLN